MTHKNRNTVIMNPVLDKNLSQVKEVLASKKYYVYCFAFVPLSIIYTNSQVKKNACLQKYHVCFQHLLLWAQFMPTIFLSACTESQEHHHTEATDSSLGQHIWFRTAWDKKWLSIHQYPPMNALAMTRTHQPPRRNTCTHRDLVLSTSFTHSSQLLSSDIIIRSSKLHSFLFL